MKEPKKRGRKLVVVLAGAIGLTMAATTLSVADAASSPRQRALAVECRDGARNDAPNVKKRCSLLAKQVVEKRAAKTIFKCVNSAPKRWESCTNVERAQFRKTKRAQAEALNQQVRAREDLLRQQQDRQRARDQELRRQREMFEAQQRQRELERQRQEALQRQLCVASGRSVGQCL